MAPDRTFSTGLEALDSLAPGGAWQCGAVHELLSPRGASLPKSVALLLARAAQRDGGAIVWNDPARELYPPAVVGGEIDPRRFIFLRCSEPADLLWALAECLRCRGVSATVACVASLSRVQARRLQLAAERGGGVGIFMRPFLQGRQVPYAAATRWLVEPAPGDSGAQRWRMELVHGHGGQVGKSILLEVDRETRIVRASAAMADRPALPAAWSQAQRITA
jgi:protein ImuA